MGDGSVAIHDGRGQSLRDASHQLRSARRLEPDAPAAAAGGQQHRSDAALLGAASLFANGSSTDDVIELLETWQFKIWGSSSHLLGVDARWGTLSLLTTGPTDGVGCASYPAVPVALSVNRVVATRIAADQVVNDACSAQVSHEGLRRASNMALAPLWLFVLSAAVCPAALAVIFGAGGSALLLIALAGALGALVRRGLVAIGGGLLTQDFAAALVAGLVAGVGTQLGGGGTSLLVAACPCMILLPGPHLLNGALDMIAYRLPLGIARLGFALTAIAALCLGVLIGLAVTGEPFPQAGPAAAVPLWIDALAGGVAAGCYAVSFATPPRLIVWPAALGLVGHAVHWVMVARAHAAPATAAIIASLLVGIATVPVARRHSLPFACIAFAAVVSMLPGVYIFPAAAGMLTISQTGARADSSILTGVFANASTSILVIAALTLGLSAPKAAHGFLRSGGRAFGRGRKLHLLHHAMKG